MGDASASPCATITQPMPSDTSGRIVAIDVVRGIAILGVVLFHLVWDLDLAGAIPQGLASSPAWLLFGRLLAGTFMILVGVSLALAHNKEIRWHAFLKRICVVAVAALIITLTTIWTFPQAYIYFGILHAIVVGSLIGILFIRLPIMAILICGMAVWTLPYFFSAELFNSRWLAWIGFAEQPPRSNDFVPVFPWVGLVLVGLAAARAAISFSIVESLRTPMPHGTVLRGMVWCGRHSLIIYLVHQPLLLALVLYLGPILF